MAIVQSRELDDRDERAHGSIPDKAAGNRIR